MWMVSIHVTSSCCLLSVYKNFPALHRVLVLSQQLLALVMRKTAKSRHTAAPLSFPFFFITLISSNHHPQVSTVHILQQVSCNVLSL
jgi:hypothetical protein